MGSAKHDDRAYPRPDKNPHAADVDERALRRAQLRQVRLLNLLRMFVDPVPTTSEGRCPQCLRYPVAHVKHCPVVEARTELGLLTAVEGG